MVLDLQKRKNEKEIDDVVYVFVVGRDLPWRGVAWRGVAWRGVAWSGVAWRGVAARKLTEYTAAPARRMQE